MKLNFEGSVISNAGEASVGGVVRDGDSRCLFSYSGQLAIALFNNAELITLQVGLRKAYCLNLRQIMVVGNSSCTIKWASGAAKGPMEVGRLVEVRDWLPT